ncbi:hypothetical protein OG792_05210 [Micromonospora sp. NBC_01699]|uniref:hypothetical protein n=1 Tax=Micromonospora sp. NBC_01699 TaxID=2975984 RepID=UPI002E368F17|nr:hypothetical protein [Micromonospora sp. NBC_01699]
MAVAVLGGGLLLAVAACERLPEPTTAGTDANGSAPTTVAAPPAPSGALASSAPTGPLVPPIPPVSPVSPVSPSKPATRAPSRPAATGARPPAGFDPARDLTDLEALTDGLTLGRPVNGVRHGELVLTIRNNGRFPVSRLMFTVELPASVSADGGDWSGCDTLRSRQDGYPAGSKCDKGFLAAGESRVYRLGVSSPSSEDNNDSTISRWLTDTWSAGPKGEMHPDTAPTTTAASSPPPAPNSPLLPPAHSPPRRSRANGGDWRSTSHHLP